MGPSGAAAKNAPPNGTLALSRDRALDCAQSVTLTALAAAGRSDAAPSPGRHDHGGPPNSSRKSGWAPGTGRKSQHDGDYGRWRGREPRRSSYRTRSSSQPIPRVDFLGSPRTYRTFDLRIQTERSGHMDISERSSTTCLFCARQRIVRGAFLARRRSTELQRE